MSERSKKTLKRQAQKRTRKRAAKRAACCAKCGGCMTKPNPAPSPAAAAKARAAYIKTHWGELGKDELRAYRAADPNVPSAALGELVAVVYRTVKGGDKGETDYVHDFKGPLPWLAFNDGGLLILGGGYTVTERGIVR